MFVNIFLHLLLYIDFFIHHFQLVSFLPFFETDKHNKKVLDKGWYFTSLIQQFLRRGQTFDHERSDCLLRWNIKYAWGKNPFPFSIYPFYFTPNGRNAIMKCHLKKLENPWMWLLTDFFFLFFFLSLSPLNELFFILFFEKVLWTNLMILSEEFTGLFLLGCVRWNKVKRKFWRKNRKEIFFGMYVVG